MPARCFGACGRATATAVSIGTPNRSGGDKYKAYHWPGFKTGETYDEIPLMKLMQERAFAIRGLPVPTLERPAPPKLLPIESAAAISWQGSVGAESYTVERAAKARRAVDRRRRKHRRNRRPIPAAFRRCRSVKKASGTIAFAP